MPETAEVKVNRFMAKELKNSSAMWLSDALPRLMRAMKDLRPYKEGWVDPEKEKEYWLFIALGFRILDDTGNFKYSLGFLEGIRQDIERTGPDKCMRFYYHLVQCSALLPHEDVKKVVIKFIEDNFDSGDSKRFQRMMEKSQK